MLLSLYLLLLLLYMHLILLLFSLPSRFANMTLRDASSREVQRLRLSMEADLDHERDLLVQRFDSELAEAARWVTGNK